MNTKGRSAVFPQVTFKNQTFSVIKPHMVLIVLMSVFAERPIGTVLCCTHLRQPPFMFMGAQPRLCCTMSMRTVKGANVILFTTNTVMKFTKSGNKVLVFHFISCTFMHRPRTLVRSFHFLTHLPHHLVGGCPPRFQY